MTPMQNPRAVPAGIMEYVIILITELSRTWIFIRAAGSPLPPRGVAADTRGVSVVSTGTLRESTRVYTLHDWSWGVDSRYPVPYLVPAKASEFVPASGPVGSLYKGRWRPWGISHVQMFIVGAINC